MTAMPAAGQINRRGAEAPHGARLGGGERAVTLVKFAAGAMSGSLALLSESAHNALDVAASGLTYYAVRVADKPADEDHPFGHAKFEAVAALFQTGFLFVLAVAVAFEALRRIGAKRRPSTPTPSPSARSSSRSSSTSCAGAP